jgi:Na+/melibiose symporter-like transporter
VGLDKELAGLSSLSGQFADGFATTLVGTLSDKFNTRWGKRIPWYFLGTIVVMPCFLGIFSYPPFVNKEHGSAFQRTWYLILPALFNIGWAAVQIYHMSIVNSLSNSNQKRDKLSNTRNGFTYAANITVLTCALIMFLTVNDKIKQFRYICFFSLTIGLLTSLFYLI